MFFFLCRCTFLVISNFKNKDRKIPFPVSAEISYSQNALTALLASFIVLESFASITGITTTLVTVLQQFPFTKIMSFAAALRKEQEKIIKVIRNIRVIEATKGGGGRGG